MIRIACLLSLATGLLLGCGDDANTVGNSNNQNSNVFGICGDGVLHQGEECDHGAENNDTAPNACRTNCLLARCGDLTVDNGEACDAGAKNGVSPNPCLLDCTITVCGDGYIGGDEVCDDGENQGGWACRGDCLQDLALCGNGSIDPGETCDNAGANSDIAPNACRTNCQVAHCGDGVIDATEDCDDGPQNGVSPNECLSDCRLTSCGDGYLGGTEICDDGALNSDSLPDSCRSNCQVAGCGDGVIDTGEECDDATANSNTAPDACRTSCAVSMCGDGVTDSGEECDDGAGNSDSSPDACRTSCLAAHCDDGVIDSLEDCDDGSLNSDTVPDACRTTCQAAHCGDGVVDTGEACEGIDLAGQSCFGLGFQDGELSCNSSCGLETRLCYTCGNGLCEPAESLSICPAECGVLEVSAGGSHTCALRFDGTAWCWGKNDDGQLGNGTYGPGTESNVPVPVAGLTGVITVSSCHQHSCAVLLDGTARCWGANTYGQLGNGTSGSGASSAYPVEVSGLSDAVAIMGGLGHTCAALSAGSAQCWGRNIQGQLGNGSFTDSSTPVAVASLTDIISITSGYAHTCAVISTGSAYCWGLNMFGQLGNGTIGSTTNSPVPLAVSDLTDAVEISGGYQHTCAARSSGSAMCWGYNGLGQLGNGAFSMPSTVPVAVSGLTDIAAIAAGYEHNCAVHDTSGVSCWGGNAYGALGNGTDGSGTESNVPVAVLGLADVTAVTGGSGHTCAALSSGSVWCWGMNDLGQLGDGNNNASNVPVRVHGL